MIRDKDELMVKSVDYSIIFRSIPIESKVVSMSIVAEHSCLKHDAMQ